MPSTVHVDPLWFVGISITIAFVILYPLVLAIVARRRLSVSWRYFWYGALIFFLFQIISRIPLITVIQRAIASQLQASSTLLWVWLLIAAVTAGLFEEVGRYVGYRWLMGREEKRWNKAIMYGIGHGGIESILIVGVPLLLFLINVIIWSTINLNTLPANAHAQIVQQVAAINAQPAWTTLLGAWERLWTVLFHVGMSVLVLQVFRRGSMSWLWLAVLLHALVDFVSVGVKQLLGPSISTTLLIEGIVALFGLLGIWIIWRLRDRPKQEMVTEDQPSVQVQPDTTV